MSDEAWQEFWRAAVDPVANAWRLHRCTNELCPQVGAELVVYPDFREPAFLVWPDLTCVCGMTPEIVDWRTPHGRHTKPL